MKNIFLIFALILLFNFNTFNSSKSFANFYFGPEYDLINESEKRDENLVIFNDTLVEFLLGRGLKDVFEPDIIKIHNDTLNTTKITITIIKNETFEIYNDTTIESKKNESIFQHLDEDLEIDNYNITETDYSLRSNQNITLDNILNITQNTTFNKKDENNKTDELTNSLNTSLIVEKNKENLTNIDIKLDNTSLLNINITKDKNKKIDDKNEKIDDKNKKIDDKNEKIDDKNKKIDDKNEKIDDKNEKIDDKSENIDDMNENIDDKNEKIDDKNEKIDDKNEKIDDKINNNKLEDNDNKIQVKNEKIEDNNNKIDAKSYEKEENIEKIDLMSGKIKDDNLIQEDITSEINITYPDNIKSESPTNDDLNKQNYDYDESNNPRILKSNFSDQLNSEFDILLNTSSYGEKFLQEVKADKESENVSKLIKKTDILTLIVSLFTIGIIFLILIGIICNMFIKSIK